MSQAQPSYAGHLDKTPILHLLIALAERSTTGTVVVEDPAGGRTAFYLSRGTPSRIRTHAPVCRLGALLQEAGWVDAATVEKTYATAAAQNELHGRVLVREAKIDEDLLSRALRTQVIRKLAWLDTLNPTAMYGVYEGVDYLASWRAGDWQVDPLLVVGQLARFHARPNQVASVLAQLGTRSLRLHSKSDPSWFGFEKPELTLLDVLRAKPQTLEALSGLGLLAPHAVERIVYALAITRHLDFGGGGSPLGLGADHSTGRELLVRRESVHPSRSVVLAAAGSESAVATHAGTDKTPKASAHAAEIAAESGPPRENPLDPALAARRAELERLSAELDGLDHFTLLGVTRETPPAQVQAQFMQLAKQYHPDRLPPGLDALRPVATRVFARMTQAQQILSNPEQRSVYERGLAGPAQDDEADQVKRILRAASAFQKAEVLLKKRMLAAAELEAERALEDDPDQADHLALLAWVRTQRTDADQAVLLDCLKMLAEALRKNPESEKNRTYRMQLLRRLGRIEEAVADCRRIVERNPHNVDALREIRLWELRRTNPQGSAKTAAKSEGEGTGLFSKLFKR